MKPFTIARPATQELGLKEYHNGTSYIGGGTNLVDLMKHHIAMPDKLVQVSDMLSKEIVPVNGGIRIGAATKNSTTAEHKLVLEKAPLVSKALLAGASQQIRNMATIGGNLLQRTRCPYFFDTTLPCNKRNPGEGCGAKEGVNRMNAIVGYSEQCVAVHPSDLCIALAALDAEVFISEQGAAKVRPILFTDFHRLPGDEPRLDNNLPEGALIVGIGIPQNPYHQHSSYVKVRDRDSYAFALVSVAAALDLDGTRIRSARLASGGVAHKPWRWKEAEAFLQGKEATSQVFAQAADLAVATTKPLKGNEFKQPMLKGAIETALQNCLSR